MTAAPTLHKQLQNVLTGPRNAHDLQRLTAAFPVLRAASESGSLALRRYLDRRPEKFYDRETYGTYLAWLHRRRATSEEPLMGYLSGIAHDINSALLFLREINAEAWHDRKHRNDAGTMERIRFVDRRVHPTYLRLTEGVLGPLNRPIAYFSRRDRGKSPDGLSLRAMMDEIEQYVPDCHTPAYRAIIRNGIAHGGITFSEDDITYRDNRGNRETLRATEITRLLDDLLDACNGMSLALKVFFLTSREQTRVLPREILIDQLREVTYAPWWEIVGCVESESIRGPQLNIYPRVNSRDRRKVEWSVVQSGILAEFFAPGYARYFLSLRSPKGWPGWAAFDGHRLRALRAADANDLSQYVGVLESLYFDIRGLRMPAFVGKLDTLVQSARVHTRLAIRQIGEALRVPSMVCRDSQMHRNGWGAVLDAKVVLGDLENQRDLRQVIPRIRRRILRSAIRRARMERRLAGCVYLPLAFAQVAVFRRDYRRQRLASFGLGADLVCTVRFQRMRRIQSPDILGSTVEQIGKWRIAWNKAWLEAQSAS